jgi:hypothetical protein
VGFRCVLAVVVFVVSSSFLLSFYRLLVGVFREVFVLFSFKFRSSFAPRRVASCHYTMLGTFLGIGRNYRTCMSKRMDFDMQLFKNQTFFVFLTWDSISQPHGEGDFAIHYTIDTQPLGSFASLFLFVYKCGYLRALTIYVWSFPFLLVVGWSLP